jgi:hypothetical protein
MVNIWVNQRKNGDVTNGKGFELQDGSLSPMDPNTAWEGT